MSNPFFSVIIPAHNSQEYIYYVANYSGMSDDVYEFYM